MEGSTTNPLLQLFDLIARGLALLLLVSLPGKTLLLLFLLHSSHAIISLSLPLSSHCPCSGLLLVFPFPLLRNFRDMSQLVGRNHSLLGHPSFLPSFLLFVCSSFCCCDAGSLFFLPTFISDTENVWSDVFAKTVKKTLVFCNIFKRKF